MLDTITIWTVDMEKDFIYAELCEVYGNLLTEKQRDITTLYYSNDLSLGEISEIKNISRQSVLDTLEKVKAILDKYEAELKVYNKKTQILSLIQNYRQENTEFFDKLIDILEE